MPVTKSANEPGRRLASYVDRIVRGEKPGDLSVQAPTKYEPAISFKAARALGLEVPPTLLARADEVVEWDDGVPIQVITASPNSADPAAHRNDGLEPR